MLNYVETLQKIQLRNSQAKGKDKDKDNASMPTGSINDLHQQANELAELLKLLKGGTMLLDEVDMLLHPLKSELNFPVGDKFDLDCTQNGERWNLPVHLFEALFFKQHAVAVKSDGDVPALVILQKIEQVIQSGITEKYLQRHPHGA